MTNGNDMIEHIQQCEHCQKVEDEINKLIDKQMECFVEEGRKE